MEDAFIDWIFHYLYPNLPPLNRKPFGLYAGEGLLTWAFPYFQADTLEAPTFKIGEGCWLLVKPNMVLICVSPLNWPSTHPTTNPIHADISSH
jgi:hypothetical protein